MDERKYKKNDPWDEEIYGTGNTRPPKNHGGIIALLLITVIFLSGIISVLGLMNVKLFKELKQMNKQEQEMPVSFYSVEESNALAEIASIPAETPVTEPMTDEAGSDPVMNLNPSPESVANIPQEGGLSWQEVYEKNIPSVVSISTPYSTGTGVILSESGYIVTNSHVVSGSTEISVLLTDDRSFAAELVGDDAVSDLAVLKIDAEDLIPAEFGNSDVLRVGDPVAAIGDPLGLELRGTFTDGIISAISRDVTVNGRTMTLLQTNAALNSGNSGGPLVNCHGQVIGINTLKISAFTDDAGVEGLGFAIPSTTVKEIVEQLIYQGYVSGRPTIGLVGEPISRFDQYYYGLPAGLYITAVDSDSHAFQTGIETGDILISVNGKRITSQTELENLIYGMQIGDAVDVVVYRSGKQYRIQLKLTEYKGD